MSFPRYPRYEDSGVEWLGEVPQHWKTVPLKAISTYNDDVLDDATVPDTEIIYVDISSVDGVNGIVAKEPMQFSAAPSRARRRVRHGDVIVSTVRTYLKAIARIREPEENLIVSTGFAVIRSRGELVSDFLGYLVSSSYFVEQVIARSNGVSYPAINASELVAIPVAVPPPVEQGHIAAFLDRETAKIDELVAQQHQLMDLLKEKCQAVISHAVTKGLNPDAPTKPSEIEWLGDMPNHWTRTVLKRVASVCGRIGFRGYTTDDLVDEGEGALALGGANLTAVGRVDLSKRTYLSWPKYEESPEIKVSVNDLVLGQRGTCGRVVLIDREIGPATINPSLVLLKRATIDSKFLCYWLMGDLIQSLFASYLNATAVPMLSQEQIGNVPVCHPAPEEQRAIAIHVERELAKLDSLTAEAQRAIDLLQERRTALISAAVTGQIDVRGVVEAKAA